MFSSVLVIAADWHGTAIWLRICKGCAKATNAHPFTKNNNMRQLSIQWGQALALLNAIIMWRHRLKGRHSGNVMGNNERGNGYPAKLLLWTVCSQNR
jgi:hypothetical protein